MKTVAIYAAVSAVVLFGVISFSPGPDRNAGMISIESVSTPILPPRVRIINTRHAPAVVWASRGAPDAARLGYVNPNATATYAIPVETGSLRVWITSPDGDDSGYVDHTVAVDRSTDLPLIIAGR